MKSLYSIFSRASLAGGSLSAGILSRRTISAPVLIAAVGALVLAVVAGYLTARFPLKNLSLLICAIALAGSLVRWPRWGLVLILAFMSTIFGPDHFSWFAEIKVINWATNGLMLLIVASSAIYWARNHPETGIFQRLFSSPQSIVTAIFIIVVLIKIMALIIERRFAVSSISQMYSFNRGLTFYLLFIPMMLLFDSGHRQRWMVGVFYTLGSIVIVRVLLELFFPDSSIFTNISMSQPLITDAPTVNEAILRLRTPGGTIELLCFWMGMMNIILRPWTWRRLAFYVPFTLAMLTGLILEFNRSYIIPMAGLLVFSTMLSRRNVRIKLFTLAAATVVVLAVAMSYSGALQEYADAASSRYGSAFSSQSLEAQGVTSRQIEQKYAWQKIEGAMLFGIGLDEFYRPPVPGMMDNLRWYIHNSYIWFWTYFGLVGLLAFLGMMATGIIRCITKWKRISDPLLQAALLGSGFSLVTLLAANLAAPKFYDDAVVPVVAVMLGLIEVIILRQRRLDSTGL